MPTNEILAGSYVKVFYEVIANIGHSFRLYFSTEITPVPDGAGFLAGTTNPDTSDPWLVSEVVVEFITRWYSNNSTIVPQLKITRVELYNAQAGENEFLGFDAGDYSEYSTLGGDHVASAYHMFVFETAERNQWRVNLYDTKVATPKRTQLTTRPVTDDASFEWFITRSSVPFTNQDGDALTLPVSKNQGYNEKLAREYGRDLN